MNFLNVLLQIIKCTTLHELFLRMGISWFAVQTWTTWDIYIFLRYSAGLYWSLKFTIHFVNPVLSIMLVIKYPFKYIIGIVAICQWNRVPRNLLSFIKSSFFIIPSVASLPPPYSDFHPPQRLGNGMPGMSGMFPLRYSRKKI